MAAAGRTPYPFLEATPHPSFPGHCEIDHTRLSQHMSVSISQVIGSRKTQEDRFVASAELPMAGGKPCAFFSVFDGTVGDFVSETCKNVALQKLAASRSWQDILRDGGTKEKIVATLQETYRSIDAEVMDRVAQETFRGQAKHYATCTGVSALMVGDHFAVAHVGDSRCYISTTNTSSRAGPVSLQHVTQLTYDHKPNEESEKSRILRNGGLVENLQNHNNKPFIRGGDFTMRKALGEQPMQLQYSRAFGGKDLKIFGLICEPTVVYLNLSSPEFVGSKFIVLASDGLWDVMSGPQCMDAINWAQEHDRSPAYVLTAYCIEKNKDRGARSDNITAIVIELHDVKD